MRVFAPIACLLPVLLCAGLAHAAESPAEQRMRQQLSSVALQLRQAQDAQGALQANLNAVTAQRDAARREAASAKAAAARAAPAKVDDSRLTDLTRQVTDLRDAQAAADQNLQRLQAEGQRLQLANAEATRAAEAAAAERDQLRGEASRQASAAQACRSQNVKLAGVADQILTAYGSIQISDLVGRSEPLFGLKRVQFENALQDLRDGIDAARCEGATTAPGAVSATPR